MNLNKGDMPLPRSGASTEIPGPYLSPEQTESLPLNSKSTPGRIGAYICCCFWPCCPASKSSGNNTATGLRPVIACFFTFSLALTVALALQMRLGDVQVTPQGSVASDSRECSQIGASVLKKGGNAVDAAVATTICLGVILPHLTGIGGGGFMAIYDHRHHHVVDAIDFREQAPMNSNLTFGMDDLSGGQAVGIPGFLKGLYLAHDFYGHLSWAELITPSIDLCKSGFLVPSNLITARNQLKSSEVFKKSSVWNHFENMEAGHDMTNLQMAATLQEVADHGPQVLYNGSLTNDLIDSIVASGGWITRSDLESYQPIRRALYRVPFGPTSWIYSMGSPSGGPLLLSALRLMNDPQKLESTTLYHHSYKKDLQTDSTWKLSEGNILNNSSLEVTTAEYGSVLQTTEKVLVELSGDHKSLRDFGNQTGSASRERWSGPVDGEMLGNENGNNFPKDPHVVGKATVMPYKLRAKRNEPVRETKDKQGEEELLSLLETLRDATFLHSLLGDPGKLKFSSKELEIIMSPSKLLKRLKEAIPPNQRNRQGSRERPAGTNVAVIDSNELYVSVVSGLGSWFGSQVMTSKGYLLNSALTNFYIQGDEKDSTKKISHPSPTVSLPILPFHKRALLSMVVDEGGTEMLRDVEEVLSVSHNQYEGGKRPLSSSVVAFVVPRKGDSGEGGKVDREVQQDVGACGQRIVIGSADALSLAQVFVNIILKGSSLVEGIEYRRLKPLAFPANYGIEVGIESSKWGSETVVAVPKGTPLPPPYASVNGIQEIGDMLASHSDSRGGGVAARF